MKNALTESFANRTGLEKTINLLSHSPLKRNRQNFVHQSIYTHTHTHTHTHTDRQTDTHTHTHIQTDINTYINT